MVINTSPKGAASGAVMVLGGGVAGMTAALTIAQQSPSPPPWWRRRLLALKLHERKPLIFLRMDCIEGERIHIALSKSINWGLAFTQTLCYS